MSEDERIEKIARELCRAAGQEPDARIRLGQPLSFPVGECTIVRPLIVPAWKTYCREARRLSMSDAEHAENEGNQRKLRPARAAPLQRVVRAARMMSIKLRRRARHFHLAPRLRGLCIAIEQGASVRLDEAKSHR